MLLCVCVLLSMKYNVEVFSNVFVYKYLLD